MHRVYVLALNEKKKEPDKEEEIASELFAFSTEQKGEELPPATGTGAGGLVAGTGSSQTARERIRRSAHRTEGHRGRTDRRDARHGRPARPHRHGQKERKRRPDPAFGGLAGRRHEGSEGKLLTEQRYVDTTDVLEEEGLLPRRLQQKTLRAGRRRDLRNPCLRPAETVHALDAGTHRMVGRTQALANAVEPGTVPGGGHVGRTGRNVLGQRLDQACVGKNNF